MASAMYAGGRVRGAAGEGERSIGARERALGGRGAADNRLDR